MNSEQPTRAMGPGRLLGLFLLLFAAYWLSATGRFSVPDHVPVFETAESLVERGTLAIGPSTVVVAQGRDGAYYSISGMGLSLASVPLYVVGRVAERLSSPPLQLYWSGPPVPGYGVYPASVPVYFVSLTNQLLTPLLAVLVLQFVLRLGVPTAAALAVTLAFAFGTLAWVHARDYFQHTLEALLLFGAVYVLFAHRDELRGRHMLLAGGLLAGAFLARFQVVVCVPLVLGYLVSLRLGSRVLTELRRLSPPADRTPAAIRASCAAAGALLLARLKALGRQWYLLALFLLPIVLVLGLQLGWNYVRFGSPLDNGYLPVVLRIYGTTELFGTPLWVGLYGLLLSPAKSLLLFAPPLVLSAFALQTFCRRQPLEALLFAGITVVYLWFYGRYTWFDGGIGWGPRYLLPLVPFWIVPVGYFLTSRRNWLIFGIISATGVMIQLLGVIVDPNPLWWAAMNAGLRPPMGFVYLPEWWPPLLQWRALQQGQYVDLWFLWVLRQFGWPVFLSTLALPLLIVLQGILLLRAQPLAPGLSARSPSQLE